jgi:hypothetical protein
VRRQTEGCSGGFRRWLFGSRCRAHLLFNSSRLATLYSRRFHSQTCQPMRWQKGPSCLVTVSSSRRAPASILYFSRGLRSTIAISDPCSHTDRLVQVCQHVVHRGCSLVGPASRRSPGLPGLIGFDLRCSEALTSIAVSKGSVPERRVVHDSGASRPWRTEMAHVREEAKGNRLKEASL